VLSTVSSKDHSSCAVQYALKFVNELLVAASEKAVAIVQPRDNETVNQSNSCTTTLLVPRAQTATPTEQPRMAQREHYCLCKPNVLYNMKKVRSLHSSLLQCLVMFSARSTTSWTGLALQE